MTTSTKYLKTSLNKFNNILTFNYSKIYFLFLKKNTRPPTNIKTNKKEQLLGFTSLNHNFTVYKQICNNHILNIFSLH